MEIVQRTAASWIHDTTALRMTRANRFTLSRSRERTPPHHEDDCSSTHTPWNTRWIQRPITGRPSARVSISA